MSYFRHEELNMEYGVLPERRFGFLESVLVNIPLLNLLYTRKIRVEIISRLGVQPVRGMFNTFRIFRKARKLNFKAKVYRTFFNILVVIDTSKSEAWLSPASFDGKELCPGHEYHFKVNLNSSVEKSTLEMIDDVPGEA